MRGSSCACHCRHPTADLLTARDWVFGSEIFKFCRSGHAGSSGGFCYLNWLPNLHRSDTIFEDYGGAWRRVASHLDLKFSSLVDLGPMDLVVALVL